MSTAWHPRADLTDKGFTGHAQNDEVALIYMRARYYVPGVGRFASADTIVPDPVSPPSFNRYSYALNDPVKYIDPTGHRVDRGGDGLSAIQPCLDPRMCMGAEAAAIISQNPDETLENLDKAAPDAVGIRIDIPNPLSKILEKIPLLRDFSGDLNINIVANRRSNEVGIYAAVGPETPTVGSVRTVGLVSAFDCPTNTCFMGTSYTAGGFDAPIEILGIPLTLEADAAFSTPNEDGSIPMVAYAGLGPTGQFGRYQGTSATILSLSVDLDDRLTTSTFFGYEWLTRNW